MTETSSGCTTVDEGPGQRAWRSREPSSDLRASGQRPALGAAFRDIAAAQMHQAPSFDDVHRTEVLPCIRCNNARFS